MLESFPSTERMNSERTSGSIAERANGFSRVRGRFTTTVVSIEPFYTLARTVGIVLVVKSAVIMLVVCLAATTQLAAQPFLDSAFALVIGILGNLAGVLHACGAQLVTVVVMALAGIIITSFAISLSIIAKFLSTLSIC